MPHQSKVVPGLQGLFRVDSDEAAGFAWERMNGATILGCYPANFPVIDDLRSVTGKLVATSYKTMNTYANYGNLITQSDRSRFLRVVDKYLTELMNMKTRTQNLPSPSGSKQSVTADINKIEEYHLNIAVPGEDFQRNLDFLKQEYVRINSLGIRHATSGAPVRLFFAPVANIWMVSPGYIYEMMKGADIMGSDAAQFKTIDKFNAQKKRVISYKVADLYRHYQGDKGGQEFHSMLKQYLMALESFNRHGYREPGVSGREIKPKDFEEIRLSLAIPQHYNREKFEYALDWADGSAKHYGMQFRVNLAPD